MFSLCRDLKGTIRQILIVGVMLLVLTGACFGSGDLSGHWAAPQMNSWISKGIIKGYPDGTVRPDAQVTRAEFMAMVNKAYNLTGSSATRFSDVNADKWYAPVVSAASAAGYISGYQDGTMRPNAPISRYEAAVVVMKVCKLSSDSSANDYFSDRQNFPSWAQGAVGAAFKKGIMSGYPNGSFSGNKYISRAEAVIALTRGVDTPVVQESTNKTYSESGTYGTATTQTIKGDVTIKTTGITLKNMIIEGNLTITREVASGDVNLQNVTIKGNTYINGGGPNSVHFTNVSAGKAYVSKDNGTVRLVVAGMSQIDRIIAGSDLKLEESNLSGSGIKSLEIETNSNGDIDVELISTKLDSLEMKAAGSSLTVDGKSGITKAIVSAKNTELNLEKGSVISTLVANASVKVAGLGVISKAEINAESVSFETKPVETTVKSGITPPTYTKPSIQSFSPADGATKVAVNADIVITFTKTVRMTNNTLITNSNVDDLITLKTSSSSGTSVSFDATVTTSGGKTVITVNPAGNLAYGKKYYVEVDSLEDTDNQAMTGGRTSTFTTISESAPKVESFSPTSSSTNVPVTSNVTLTFNEVVRKTSGSAALTNSNVDALIILRKTNSGGPSVNFDATVTTSGGKTIITVNPDGNLANGQLYYISVSGLEDVDDNELTGTTSSTFTTDYLPYVYSYNPTSGATGVSLTGNIVITMNETLRLLNNTTLTDTNIDNQIVLKKTNASGESVAFNATVLTVSGKTVITVDPSASLTPNQLYYIAVSGLEDSADQAITGTLSITFRAATDAVPTVESFNPSNGATGISISSPIILTMSEILRLTNDSPLANGNVGTQVSLKKTSSSGDAVPFTATVATVSGKTVITVTPSTNLVANQPYYVAVAGLEDSADQALSGTLSSTFTTAPIADPAPTVESISPANGATGISLGSNIVISFSETMRMLNDSPLLNNTVDSLITLKTPGSSGTPVDFDATVAVSGGKTVITINPASDFLPNVSYYVAFSGVEDGANQAITGNGTFTTLKLNADFLTALAVDKNATGDGGVVGMSPGFSGDTTTYSGTVINTVGDVRITCLTMAENTAIVKMGSTVKVDGICNLDVGINTITVVVSKAGCNNVTYTIHITREAPSDLTAPEYAGVTVSNGNQRINITFSETLLNNMGDDTALKNAVTLSGDGATFNSLADGDVVTISGSTVVIDLAVPLTAASSTNAVRIASGTFKDTAGNVVGSETTVTGIAAQ